MKNPRFLTLFAVLPVFLLLFVSPVTGAPASDTVDEVTPQEVDGLTLPCWQPGEYQGNFDIRIWPEELVLWLERENLRAMVKDPEIPSKERAALKRILAMQTAFRPRED